MQVHTSMCTHVHAYVARVCDEMGLFLSHRLAHIHMYVLGAERKVCASMSWMRLFVTVDDDTIHSISKRASTK